jgi:ABC-2 type transport system permease protein
MSQNKESTVKEFKSTKLKISVFDNDNTSLSKGLYKYLDSKHKMTEVDENLDAYRDALYSRTVDYVLIIPKGFEESVNNGKNDNLETYKSPASIASQFADIQINNFVSIIPPTFFKSGVLFLSVI